MKSYPHLNDILKTEWQRLFDLIPAIENTRSFGTIKGGEKRHDGYIEIPYVSQSELVRGFIKLVYDLGIILNLDWPAWDEGGEFIMKKDFTDHDVEKSATSISINNTIMFSKDEAGMKVMFMKESKARANYSLHIRELKETKDGFYYDEVEK